MSRSIDWTPEESAFAQDMVRLRKRYTDISSAMAERGWHRSGRAIRNHLERFGMIEPRSIRWSEAQAAATRMMVEQGKQPQEIAEAVGRSLDSVRLFISRNGLSALQQPKAKPYCNPELHKMHAEGRSRQEMAAALSVPVGTIDTWVGKALKAGLLKSRSTGSKWDDAKKQKLVELAAEGYGPNEIHRRTGWPISSIGSNAKKLGIQFQRYPANRKAASAEAVAKKKAERARIIAERNAKAEEDRRLKAEVAARLWGKTEGARPFLERESGECRWPLGERGNYFACCKPTEADQSYCRAHRLMAGGYKRPQVAGFKMVRPYVEQEARVAA